MIKETIDKNNAVKPNTKFLEKLKRDFPECFDKAGNFLKDVFDEKLSLEEISVKKEGYSLEFLGKSYARYLSSLDSNTVIVPDNKNSKIESENIYLVGDNLDALQHLKYSYEEKIKFIYIDPPYNTGSDEDFIYNDKFDFTSEDLAKKIDIEEEEAKRILNLQGQNTHSAWLTFMYPRLEIARDLLKKDGVIFISIDDHEQADLKKLCDSIFGEANFITSMIWAAGKKNDSRYISVSHEYMLCYVKSKEYLDTIKATWRERKQGLEDIYSAYKEIRKKGGTDYATMTKEMKEWYKKLPDNHPAKNHSHYSVIDENGLFFPDNASWPGGGGPKYEVIHPITKKPVKIPSRGWIYPTQERMQEMIDAGKIFFGPDETYVPCVKSYLIDREMSTPYSVFYKDGRAATKRLRDLFDGVQVFENPKDEEIIEQILTFIGLENGDIVLDFFSGSGTTAHSVLSYNVKNDTRVKFIMVQLNEKIKEDKPAFNAGYKTIDEVGRDRISRAAKKLIREYPEKSKTKDLHFKTYFLKNVQQNTLDKLTEFNPSLPIGANDIKDAFGKDTILSTWMIKDGYGFNQKIINVDLCGYEAYVLSDKEHGTTLYLLENMYEKSIKELIKKIEGFELNPDRVIEYGYAFNYDSNISLRSNLKTLKNKNALDVIIRY